MARDRRNSTDTWSSYLDLRASSPDLSREAFSNPTLYNYLPGSKKAKQHRGSLSLSTVVASPPHSPRTTTSSAPTVLSKSPPTGSRRRSLSTSQSPPMQTKKSSSLTGSTLLSKSIARSRSATIALSSPAAAAEGRRSSNGTSRSSVSPSVGSPPSPSVPIASPPSSPSTSPVIARPSIAVSMRPAVALTTIASMPVDAVPFDSAKLSQELQGLCKRIATALRYSEQALQQVFVAGPSGKSGDGGGEFWRLRAESEEVYRRAKRISVSLAQYHPRLASVLLLDRTLKRASSRLAAQS